VRQAPPAPASPYNLQFFPFIITATGQAIRPENSPAVMPDKRIDPDWADNKAGRDSVMDWILSPGTKL